MDDFIIKIVVTHSLVFQHDFVQIRGDGNIAFFVPFTMEKDYIISDIFTLDFTDFC